jgi:hypothetical protein
MVMPEGRWAPEQEMAERDVWLAGALESLSETERGVLEPAGTLMERLADGA